MFDTGSFHKLTSAKLAAMIAGAVVATSVASSAVAQPGYQRTGDTARHVARHARDGRNAFGMAAGRAFADPNSPAATGGGSIGYNRQLLEY